jgi:hypothetical protein
MEAVGTFYKIKTNDYRLRFQNLPLGGDSILVASHKIKPLLLEKIPQSFEKQYDFRILREQRSPSAIATRKTPCRDARKTFFYKPNNTTIACRPARNGCEREYFLRPEHRVWDNFYSDNKTCEDRP